MKKGEMKMETMGMDEMEMPMEMPMEMEMSEMDPETEMAKPMDMEMKDSDDEFMEDLMVDEISPEKAKKMKESLMVMIKNCEKTVDSLKDLAEANKSGALSILKEKVKDNLSSSLDIEDIKELKDGVKQLESVKVTMNLVSTLCSQYSCAMLDIDKYKKQMAKIDEKCRQMQLPFEEKEEPTVMV